MFKKGEKVDYHSIINGSITSKNHIIEELGKLPSGHKVAWISGKSGCVAIESLTYSENNQNFN